MGNPEKEMPADNEKAGTEQSANGPRVLDKVRDQEGRVYFKYGTDNAAMWFSAADLIKDEKVVFADLANLGFAVLSRSARTAFIAQLDQHPRTRDALVASRPGWLTDEIYIFGDGTLVREDGLESEILVTFKPDTRFAPVGKIKAWKAGIESIVAGEPLAAFLLCYAFVGPLLHFAPSYVPNPFVELVGPPECGKTTFAVLSASVFAGDPNSHVGGGDTWNFTEMSFDELRALFRDSMLFLDEQNEMDASLKSSGKMAFKQSSSAGRRRLSHKPDKGVKVALLSTANEASKDAMRGAADVVAAAGSRTCTIAFKGPIMTVCPKGFSEPSEAMHDLRKLCNQQYGMAGHKFVRALARHAKGEGAKAVRATIESLMDDFRARNRSKEGSARVLNTFALVYAAGQLAREWAVLPDFDQTVGEAVQNIFELANPSRGELSGSDNSGGERAIARVRAILAKHSSGVSDLSEGAPVRLVWLPPFAYLKRIGDAHTYYVPTAALQAELGRDCKPVLRQLRAANRLKFEGGKTPKLSIKAPSFVPLEGQRVYCITL
ncbi:DUF927 domain-containing protein [Mesorhizobium sp. WSM4976]|uniref:DUF927 domain-containing protein n=1 Tax=Mesorhizobium sp. WSM4976 TaxID=3038549 RepID=UPI002416E839|nr:DUF927 domain-containing protein [Mesorhizobium sp. WSM4976]MDG4895817.1 DUF927 domain-containing protein [Mesorhizobium sp. WSM4976]